MENEKLFTVKEVAERYKVDDRTVTLWIRTGKLKGRKPPGCRDHIVKKSDFDEFWYGEPQPDTNR